MGQPKMNYWKLYELHKNKDLNFFYGHPISAYAQKFGNLNFEQLMKHILRVFPSFCGGGGGGGRGVNSILLDWHTLHGSQPFNSDAP